MFKANISTKCDHTWSYLKLQRGLRSLKLPQKKLNELERKHAEEEALIKVDKAKQLENWRIEDEEKLINWTPWRRQYEDVKASKYVPLPLSLTGFGDGARPRYWTHKLRTALVEYIEAEKKSQLTFAEKIPASLSTYLKNNPDLLDDKHKPLRDKLIETKEESKTVGQLKDEPKQYAPLQFPFELLDELRKSDPEASKEITAPKRFPSGLIDQDYENWLQHHNFVQEMALKLDLSIIKPRDYEDEVYAWGSELWRRNYGSSDPTVPTSTVPCGGCGAYLHCTDSSIPGYLPSERFKSLKNHELKKSLCQRCDYLHNYNISIDVNVPSDLYPSVITDIQNRIGIVILMVDLTDFPGSIWPGIIHLIGKKRKIYCVGNKVDLLPKDSVGYLARIEDSLKKHLNVAGAGNGINVRHTCLISAKTGYGVESLVTKLLREANGTRDIFLVGCTNVGKSTLFNALLQSDLCAARENDLIQRATTSVWPGTTLNLLKFPINKLRGWQLRLRHIRLKRHENYLQKEKDAKVTLYRQTKNSSLATLSDRVSMTFRSDVPFTVESGHPMAKRHEVPKPFDPKNWPNHRFFHDTPGAIYKEQLLNLLTTEELLKTIPRSTIAPRTFSLWPFQTLFLAGLGRIDVVHARQNILLTVFASHYLPIHVTFTEQAKQFYETFLGSSLLGVPIGGPERLEKWPILIPREIDLTGIGWKESCADIVLSSAGWVSVTASEDTGVVLKAYTPEGRGLFVREPAVLPFAVNMRGEKIRDTPCFEAGATTIDEIGDDNYIGSVDENEIRRRAKERRVLPAYEEDPPVNEKRHIV